MGRRVLGIVDSDSFVKWGANLLAGAPSDWTVELVAIKTRSTASAAQVASALTGAGTAHSAIAERSLWEIVESLERDPVDTVLVSTLGPVAEVLITEINRRVQPRPVVVTGLPGISIPPKWKGLFLRAQADLFVLHSRREVAEYTAMALEHDVEPRFGLATLPFLVAAAKTPKKAPDSIVFAAQPSVPPAREDRELIVAWLVAAAKAHPSLRVVLKTRAQAGEKQTHHEEYPFDSLLPADPPSNLVVETGPMAPHLARAVGLVSVSSTAVIEAIALDVPSIVLTDFGVTHRLINEVFIGSNLFGTSADLVAARFHDVKAEWRENNYFHQADADDWASLVSELMTARDAGTLPQRHPARHSRGGALRRAWERKLAFGPHDRTALGKVAFVIGVPIRAQRRLVRRFRRPSQAPPTEAAVSDFGALGSALPAQPALNRPDTRPTPG